MPITAEETAELDAHSYAADIHLTIALRRFGAEIAEEASIVCGMRRCNSDALNLTDLREAVLSAAAALAAYDAAVATGKVKISNAEWRRLREAAAAAPWPNAAERLAALND
jgi:5-enolpyruvylshikimate-3-phosphate synthase